MIPGFEQFFQSKHPVPFEIAENIRSMLAMILGSPAKLDIWLTRIADELADPHSPRVRPLPAPNMPPVIRDWMRRPREVVDGLLDQMHGLSVWGYTLRITGEGDMARGLITDQTCGHLLEEVGGRKETIIQAMTEKYGPNIEIVKE